MMWPFAIIAAAFFIGAIPFGYLIAKRRGVRIQDHGSGNIGATNVARVLGLKTGAIVLLLDAAKGAIPTFLALHYIGFPPFVIRVGFAAIVGHIYSPFLGGQGGKGVATSLGVFLVLAPGFTALAVLAFALVFALTRVPALGSLSGSAVITALLFASQQRDYAIFAALTTVLLVYTHRENLQRVAARFTNRR